MVKYLLPFLIYFLQEYHSTDSSDLLYLVKTKNDDYCLTNSSSAVYYTTENGSIVEGKRNWTADLAHVDQNWKKVNSSQYDGLPVFDQRWTNLPTQHMTRLDRTKNNMLLNIDLKDFTSDQKNFKITLSLMARESEFFLCDEKDVSNSKCYWFIIGKNNEAILRECHSQIPVAERSEIAFPCNKSLTTKPFSYLSKKKWSHIILQREGNTFFLRYIENGKVRNVLKYTFPNPHKIYHMLIHTEDKRAFYKLHNYEYLRATKAITPIEIKNPLKVKNGKVCISVFTTTCIDCQLEIYLSNMKYSNGWKTARTIEKIQPSFGFWRPHKLVLTPTITDGYVNVAIRGKLINPSISDPFWAIDSFRECKEEEYQKYTNQARLRSCQLVSNDNKVEWNNSLSETNCQFSNDNNNVGNKDDILKICKKTNNGQSCYCYKEDNRENASTLNNLKLKWNKNNTFLLHWSCTKFEKCWSTTFQIVIKNYQNQDIHTRMLMGYKCRDKCNFKVKKIFPSSTEVNIEISALIGGQKQSINATEYSYPAVPNLVNSSLSIIEKTSARIRFSLNITEKNQQEANTSKYLLILLSERNNTMQDKNLLKLKDVLRDATKLTNFTKVIAEINLLKYKSEILDYTIGNGSSGKSELLNETIHNFPLKNGQLSGISVIITNRYKNKYSLEMYSLPLKNNEYESSLEKHANKNNSNGILLLVLAVCVIVVVMIVLFIYMRRRYKDRSNSLLTIINESNEIELSTEAVQRKSRNIPSGAKRTNKQRDVRLKKAENLPYPSDRIHSKAIKLSDFEEYVRKSLQYKELERQHELFPRGQTQSCEYGSLDVNKLKNRYENIITYDHSRVILKKIPGDEYSDYINASYIHGHNISKAYIATQGPKRDTLRDFWRMIWQENVNYIVMIANINEGGKEKVHQYWPTNGELNFEDICVQFLSVKVFVDFEKRIFHLIQGHETRKLVQIHFTGWPDQDKPCYPHTLRPFVENIVKIPLTSSSPIVIHCSAGVGRTGTILLIDICLRMAAEKGTVDFLNILQKLRQQRPNMVDNEEQYKLAHLVVLDYLIGLRTNIRCDELDEKLEKLLSTEDNLKIQIKYLWNSEWQDDAMKSVGESQENHTIHSEKNRFDNIIPEKHRRMLLSKYPFDDISSTYINAVRVDGIKCPEKFIVTQQPMPNTVGDFWRLILDMGSEIIISLNEINLEDETCCKFWPTAKEPELHPVDFIVVEFKKLVTFTNYDIYFLNVNMKQEKNMTVKVIAYKEWQARDNLPLSCRHFFSFWEDADSLTKRYQNIIVTCFDGATASGVYVALSFVIEKMRIEEECDVCSAVRLVRHNRKHFVVNMNQLIFLYEAALIYNIKCFT